jgi:hypothetical protein
MHTVSGGDFLPSYHLFFNTVASWDHFAKDIRNPYVLLAKREYPPLTDPRKETVAARSEWTYVSISTPVQ